MDIVQSLTEALTKSLPLNDLNDKEALLESCKKNIEDVLKKHIRVVGAFNDYEKDRYESIKDTKEFKDYLENNCSKIIAQELIDSNLYQKSIHNIEGTEGNNLVKSVFLTYILDNNSLLPKQE